MRRDVALILLAFVVVGVLCGLLWHTWWAPAPEGVAVEGRPYFDDDVVARGLGLYVVIGAVAGLVLGIVAAFVFENDEVATVVALLVGAIIAGWLMALVGQWLGPESAVEAAKDTADFEPVRADLSAGWVAPFVAFPGGAMVGAVFVLVTFHRRSPHP